MDFTKAKRVVIKVGSSTLTHKTGLLNLRRIEQLIKIISDLKNSGREIVLVSSGAVAVGMGKIGLSQKPADIRSKQACAAIGQCELMYIYDKLFSEHNHVVSQVLLTGDVISDEKRKQNVVNTFLRLLEYGSIPIVNENDTVSIDEIEMLVKFGDNDTLSAIVSLLVGADALVILSDIDGLYDKDPHRHKDAKLISRVAKIDESIRALAGDTAGHQGTGGMITKLKAADMVMPAGISMAIINGGTPNTLYDLFDGKQVGTLFEQSNEE
ncbi:MAG: glutamate 5-kinase [Oscillospiraceae bacterium]